MKQRAALFAAALLLAPFPAIAADLAGPYPTPGIDCANYGNVRGYDDVLQPPKTAYIVASSCGTSIDFVTLLTLGKREKILVYYDGGSMYKTDIDLLVVPR